MNKFDNAWCYEIVRLRELAGEQLDDRSANQLAAQAGTLPEKRLLSRAQALSDAASLEQSLTDVRQTMRLGLLAAWIISLLAGASAGFASLGDGTQPVNVIWALGSLLLLPTLMLVVWLLMSTMRTGSGGWLGHWFELVVGKVLNKGLSATGWRAWLRMAARANMHRWWLAFITHSTWFWFLTGMMLSLLLAFSLRHYTFVWQTTWLSENVFVDLAQTFGALPARFGFTVPDVQTIQTSGNVAVDEPSVRLAWANWLVGVLLVFGWLPRLLLVLASYVVLRSAYAKYQIDTHDAYALQTLQTLDRLINQSTVDAPAGPVDQWQKLSGIEPGQARTAAVAVSLETSLPRDLHAQIPVDTILLPPIDDLDSRQQTEQRLLELMPARLLVIVDARHTPDRGMIRTILALGSRAAQTEVCLLHLDSPRARRDAWSKRLDEIGVLTPTGEFAAHIRWLRGIG